MHSIHRGITASLCVALAFALVSCGSTRADESAAGGVDQDAVHAKNVQGEAGTAQMAAAVLNDAVADPDHSIPQSLLDRAQGIVVVPGVTKAALGIGGQWGKGLAVERLADGGWSAPAYVSIGGASYGFQIGAQSTDLVLVFTGESGLKALIDDHLKLGADVSIAAGPVGRNVEFGTNLTMDSAIYSYSRTEGLFAGASLDGAVLEFDEDRNHAIYGADVTAADLLSGKVAPVPAAAPFRRAVAAHTPPQAAS